MPLSETQKPENKEEKFRVMVVDDSAVIRGLISRMLEADPSIEVVATAPNGQAGLAALERFDIEVVVLDIEMPVMDGLTALPLMLKADPNLKVIMASTLTLKNASISLKAMELGAADYVPKPTSSREVSGSDEFKAELLGKVKILGNARRRTARPIAAKVPGGAPPKLMSRPVSSVSIGPSTLPKMREPSAYKPEIIAIGSSTGGPQALFKVLGDLKGEVITQPIIITQHMPATFTKILSEHITTIAGRPAKEGESGERLEAGKVYIAPGGLHMVVKQKGTERVLQLLDTPPENFCRPAVDPMFRSVAEVYGNRSFGIVLTGMGSDGAKGSVNIVNAGGTIIAQNEATSVVWGMPGATVAAGSCAAVLPLDEVSAYIKKHAIKRV